jgi:hypothetical protein
VNTTINQPQKSGFDQRRKTFFNEWPQVSIDRVHFQNHDLIFLKQFVHKIHRRERGYIPRAQHQRNLPLTFAV